MNHPWDTLFHFLRSLTQENELCFDDLVSFFKELDTRKRTRSDELVSFFKDLDTRKGTILQLDPMNFKRSWLPRGSHLMGEEHS